MRGTTSMLLMVMTACGNGKTDSGSGSASKPATATIPSDAATSDDAAASAARVVKTQAEASAAVGKIVRIRGTCERHKLGDTIRLSDFSVTCVDSRFPDDRLKKEIDVEGILEFTHENEATVDSNGGHSQGTGPGGMYVISKCTLL